MHLQTLQFNVAGLLKGPMGDSRVFELRTPASELDELDESVAATGPFVGVVRLLKTNRTVLARLKGEVPVQLECSRCLDPVSYLVALEAEEEFHPSIDILTGRPILDTGDDDALVIDDHHILDLTELFRQAMLLALPMTPLCRDDCKGLCPTCGINRNSDSCTCAENSVDPRWASLGLFFEAQDEDSPTIPRAD